MPDLEGLDARGFGIGALQGSDHLARTVAQGAGVVELRAVALAHEAAVTGKEWKSIGQDRVQRGLQMTRDSAQHSLRYGHIRRQDTEVPVFAQPIGEGCRADQPIADGGKVTGAAAAHGKASQGAFEIGHEFKRLA